MSKFTRIHGEGLHKSIRLPRAGKIRLGIKGISEKTKKEYPIETSYFVCPPEVKAKFGEQPTRLSIMLPTENEEEIYRQYFAVYGKNQRIKCQGDALEAERRNDKGEIEKIACPSPKHCDYAKEHGCKQRFDLMVVLPDVSVGSVYQVSSGSTTADIDIRSGMEMCKSLYGRISWVPLELVREPMKMIEPGSNRMQTHYPLKIRPIGDLQMVMAVRKDPMLIPTQQTTKFIVAEPVIEGQEDDSPVVQLTEEQEKKLEPQASEPTLEPKNELTEKQKLDQQALDSAGIVAKYEPLIKQALSMKALQDLTPAIRKEKDKLLPEHYQHLLDVFKEKAGTFK